MAETVDAAEAGDTPTTDLVPAQLVPRPLRLRLEVTAGPDLGKKLALEAGTYFVGKGSGCDLVLADAAVSRRHLEVAVLADGVRMRDLGSTNGTFYEGARFELVKLGPGAQVRLGHTELTLASPDMAASSGSAASAASSASSTSPIPPLRAAGVSSSPIARDLPLRFGALESGMPTLRHTFAVLERASVSDSVILVQGETGTGKELVAEAVHEASPRRRGPFVICDLAALPRSLIESELFGHVRGAFTGADRDRRGAFAEADGGTLFLDEIGELELDAQPRLLRALERRQVKPVGSSTYISTNVRVVAATNRDLLSEVRAGRFREDLYHRLAVVRVFLPPLRERREDVALLVMRFLEQSATAAGRKPPIVPPDTMALLRAHEWPGNIRELRNVLERAVSLAPDEPVLDPHLLGLDEPSLLRADVSGPPVDISSTFKEAKDRLVQAWEREYVMALLAKYEGNVSLAARSGGLDRVYLHRLIKKHGLAPT